MKNKTFIKSVFLFLLCVCLHAFASADVVNQWIHTLSGRFSPVQEKARACQRLGEYGDERAIPALAGLLTDPVLNVYARAALERIPGKQGRAALVNALDVCEGTELVGVIESLGSLGATEAVGRIEDLVRDKNPEVSDASMRALGRMGSKTRSVVLRYLKDPSPDIRASAATAALLSAENGGGLSVYESILKTDVPRPIWLAALRGAILAKKSVSYLMEQLRAPESDVRDVAFLALRSFSGKGLTDVLHEELDRAEGADPVRVVYALNDMPNQKTAGVLINHLNDAQGDFYLAIVRVLGRIGGADAVDALLPLASQEEVKEALVAMDGIGVDGQVIQALSQERDSGRRIDLIQVLGDRSADEALPVLMRYARDNDVEVTKASLRALRPLVALSEVPELISIFKKAKDDSQNLALNALVSACKRSDPPEKAGKQVLAELEKLDDWDAREPWKRVLVAMGYLPALPVIEQGLLERDSGKVQSTIRLLSQWPGPEPIDALIKTGKAPSYAKAVLRSVFSLLALSKDNEKRAVWLEQIQPWVSSDQEKRQLISLAIETYDHRSLALLEKYSADSNSEIAEEARTGAGRLKHNMRW